MNRRLCPFVVSNRFVENEQSFDTLYLVWYNYSKFLKNHSRLHGPSRMKRRVVVIGVVILFLLSLIPATYRTITWSSDAYGLISLATLPKDKFTFNPYSKNGYFVGPAIALWILKHFDYPYNRCSKISEIIGICDIPLIMWAGRTLGNGDSQSEKRAYEIIALLIKRGEPLNDRCNGMTVVHEAILYRQPRYLTMVLDAGADPHITIQRKGKKSHGLDAFEFVELLESMNPGGFQAIKQILGKKRT